MASQRQVKSSEIIIQSFGYRPKYQPEMPLSAKELYQSDLGLFALHTLLPFKELMGSVLQMYCYYKCSMALPHGAMVLLCCMCCGIS